MPVGDVAARAGRVARTFEQFWVPLLAAKLGDVVARDERRVHLGDDPAPHRGAPGRHRRRALRRGARRGRAGCSRTLADRARGRGARRSRRACRSSGSRAPADGGVEVVAGVGATGASTTWWSRRRHAPRPAMVAGLDAGDGGALERDPLPGRGVRRRSCCAGRSRRTTSPTSWTAAVHRGRGDDEPRPAGVARRAHARVPPAVRRVGRPVLRPRRRRDLQAEFLAGLRRVHPVADDDVVGSARRTRPRGVPVAGAPLLGAGAADRDRAWTACTSCRRRRS